MRLVPSEAWLLYYITMNFSRRIDFAAEPNILEKERRARFGQGLPVFDLSQSNPTRTGLLHASGELSRALSDEKNIYYAPDPKGPAAARRAIAEHFRGRGPELAEERFFLCASTSEGYSYLFKLLCDPGDCILVPRPGYPLFEHLAALESVQAIGYRLEYDHPSGWHIDVGSLERSLDSPSGKRIKAIVLINPNNPTGSYVGERELDAILRLCTKHSLALIVDEVFFDFSLEPRSRPGTLYGNGEVPTFVLDGLSKRLCLPQLKLGWIYASGPRELVEQAGGSLELICDTFLSAGTPVMNAVGALLKNENAIQNTVKERMKAVMGIYRQILEYENSPHSILACEGGWTALVRSPRFESEEMLALGLLREEGLFVHPGYFFDMEQEAFFAFSLIIDPADAHAAALKYRSFFDRF